VAAVEDKVVLVVIMEVMQGMTLDIKEVEAVKQLQQRLVWAVAVAKLQEVLHQAALPQRVLQELVETLQVKAAAVAVVILEVVVVITDVEVEVLLILPTYLEQ
jgi:hypothetical protein